MEFSEKDIYSKTFLDCAGKEEVFKSRIMKLEFILESCVSILKV